jgi:hypothetical protein
MSGYRRFLMIEAATSGVINAALSVAFALPIFLGKETIPPMGARGFGPDFLIQTFMVTLMGVTVPSLIVRKRLRDGRLPEFVSSETGPLWKRALLGALLATVLVGGAAMALSSLSPALPFMTLLPMKAVYGGLLGATVTIWAVRKTARPAFGD